MFQKGDSIIETHTGARGGGIMFGVVLEAEVRGWMTVVFPTGTFHSLASHCRLYSEWLEDNGF